MRASHYTAGRLSASKPVVYIASPYTKGDQALNVRAHCKVFDTLFASDLVWPVAPLWSHLQHILYPRSYEDWLEYDCAMIPRYDACFRVNAEIIEYGYRETQSAGADREVALFEALGKPVFRKLTPLYRWAKQWIKEKSAP